MTTLFSEPVHFGTLFQQPAGDSQVGQCIFGFSLYEHLQCFLDACQYAVSEGLYRRVVDVGIFSKQVYLFRTHPYFVADFPVFPVMTTEYYGRVSYEISVVFEAVDVIFVFSVVIKKEVRILPLYGVRQRGSSRKRR